MSKLMREYIELLEQDMVDDVGYVITDENGEKFLGEDPRTYKSRTVKSLQQAKFFSSVEEAKKSAKRVRRFPDARIYKVGIETEPAMQQTNPAQMIPHVMVLTEDLRRFTVSGEEFSIEENPPYMVNLQEGLYYSHFMIFTEDLANVIMRQRGAPTQWNIAMAMRKSVAGGLTAHTKYADSGQQLSEDDEYYDRVYDYIYNSLDIHTVEFHMGKRVA